MATGSFDQITAAKVTKANKSRCNSYVVVPVTGIASRAKRVSAQPGWIQSHAIPPKAPDNLAAGF
jgi:hypothetical protein